MSLLPWIHKFEAALHDFPVAHDDPIQADIQQSRALLTHAQESPETALKILSSIEQLFAKPENAHHTSLVGRISFLCGDEILARLPDILDLLNEPDERNATPQNLMPPCATTNTTEQSIAVHTRAQAPPPIATATQAPPPSDLPAQTATPKHILLPAQATFPIVNNGRLFADWERHLGSTLHPEESFGLELLPIATTQEALRQEYLVCEFGGQTTRIRKDHLLAFLSRNGISRTESYSHNQLVEIVEAIAKECTAANISLFRFQEVIRRVVLGVKLVPRLDILPTATQIPSLPQLIGEFRKRRYIENVDTLCGSTPFQASGYLPNGETIDEQKQAHERDKALLLQVVAENNRRFARRIQCIGSTDEGFIDQIVMDEGQELRVRADLHSDLPSLLAFFSMQKKEGSDPHYLLLGDYTDRGFNDIETLLLVLVARLESPDKVHLLRGNHEDTDIQLAYSIEGDWFNSVDNRALFSDCYKTFPLAICITTRPHTAAQPYNRQYVHFSHGLFNPGIDLAPLFESDHASLIVPQTISPTERRYFDIDDSQKAKQEKAFARLSHISLAAMRSFGYMWFDLQPISGITRGGCSFGLAPDDVHAYGQYAGYKTPIKAFYRGHEHQYSEAIVARKGCLGECSEGRHKVIVTTLPVGTTGGAYKDVLGTENVQGVVLKTAVKVRDWKKQLIIAENEGAAVVFQVNPTILNMYDVT